MFQRLFLCLLFWLAGVSLAYAAPREYRNDSYRAPLNRSLPTKKALQSAASYHQDNDTIDAAISYVTDNGQSLEEITLTEANDTLLQTIQAHCPQLKSFSYYEHLDTFSDVTDSGLAAIGSFPKLDSLVIVASWDKATDVGMNGLLSAQNEVKALTINKIIDNALFFTDESLKIISEYEQLSSLSLHAFQITEEGVYTFLQSPPAQKNIVALELVDVRITPKLLKELQNFSALREVSLIWGTTSEDGEKFLRSLSDPTKVCLYGLEITPGIAKILGQMSSLTELVLDECSEKLYATVLQNLPQLQTLTIFNSADFSDTNAKQIARLPLRSLTLYDAKGLSGDGLKALCESKLIQSNLRELYISKGSSIDSAGFARLKSLSLESLFLADCKHFDESAFSQFTKGPLGKTLRALGLWAVSITDKSFETCAKLKKLDSFFIVYCKNISQEGMHKFLQMSTLNDQLKRFCFSSMPMDLKLLPLLGNFQNLTMLVVGDYPNRKWPEPHDEEEKILDNLPYLTKNNTLVIRSFGGVPYFEEFLSGHDSFL